LKLIPVLVIFVSAPIAQAQSASAVAFSESSHSILAFSPSGTVSLPVVRVSLDIRHSDGGRERGVLIVVFDPDSSHYFWRYNESYGASAGGSFLDELERGREAVYVNEKAITDFYAPSALYVQAHSEKAVSLGAAERLSIEQFGRLIPVIERGGSYVEDKEIKLWGILGIDFSCPPYGDPQFSPTCGFGAKKISSITKEGEQWRVVLRNRWDQLLVLDAAFKIVSSQRLPEVPNKQ
jgi:hypothetical protein